jgi:uncharacterized delta-60 repeat protein
MKLPNSFTLLSALTVACLTLAHSAALAFVPGAFDPSYTSVGGFDHGVLKMVRLRDGKFLAVGEFSAVNGEVRKGIVRLLANGGIDRSFHARLGLSAFIRDVAVQPDGKILVCGFIYLSDFDNAVYLLRLNRDGGIDPTFNIGPQPNGAVRAVRLQRDGKLLVAGAFTQFSGQSRNRLVRLLPSGQIDPSFNIGSGPNADLQTMEIDSQNRLLIAGSFTEYNGSPYNRIARIQLEGAAGEADPAFHDDNGFNGYISRIALLNNGSMMVSGTFTAPPGTTSARVTRLSPNGLIDPTFNSSGTGLSNEAAALAVLPDQSILVGMSAASWNATNVAGLIQLTPDGDLLNAFNSSGSLPLNDFVFSFLPLPDGGVWVSGRFTSFLGESVGRAVRLDRNLNVVSTRLTGVGASRRGSVSSYQWVNAVAVQPDSKILVAGGFRLYAGQSVSSIVRLERSGQVDPAFRAGLTGQLDSGRVIRDVALQSDGKIIAVGNFDQFDGQIQRCIVRLLPDGTLDPTFNVGGAGAANVPSFPAPAITTVKVDSLDRILIGGSFTHFNAQPRLNLARLLPNGQLDTEVSSFNPDEVVEEIALDSQGRIWVSGAFTGGIMRLKEDGTVDLNANLGSGANGNVTAVVVDDQDRAVIAGNFTKVQDNDVGRIARLLPNGQFDTSFNRKAGLGDADPFIAAAGFSDGTRFSLNLDAEGRILLGGFFFGGYNGESPTDKLLRLLPDGALDRRFVFNTLNRSNVHSIALDPAGGIVVGGDFGGFDGKTTNGVARVLDHYQFSKGSFSGVLSSQDSANDAFLSHFNLKMNRTGGFSGSLRHRLGSIRFQGSFDADQGHARVALPVSFGGSSNPKWLDLYYGRGAAGAPEIIGQLIEEQGLDDILLAELRATSRPFAKPINGTAFAGLYNAAFQPSGAPLGAFDGITPPSGFGFSSIRVSKNGTARLAGRTADGLSWSRSIVMTGAGDLAVYVPLRRSGHLVGSIRVDAFDRISNRGQVSGQLRWLTPGVNGVSAGTNLTLGVSGSQYVVPPNATPPLFGIPGTGTSAITVVILGGSLPVEPPSSRATATGQLSTSGSYRADSFTNLIAISVSINRRTGLISGTAKVDAARKSARLWGIVTATDLAKGFALLPNGASGSTPSSLLLSQGL